MAPFKQLSRFAVGGPAAANTTDTFSIPDVKNITYLVSGVRKSDNIKRSSRFVSNNGTATVTLPSVESVYLPQGEKDVFNVLERMTSKVMELEIANADYASEVERLNNKVADLEEQLKKKNSSAHRPHKPTQIDLLNRQVAELEARLKANDSIDVTDLTELDENFMARIRAEVEADRKSGRRVTSFKPEESQATSADSEVTSAKPSLDDVIPTARKTVRKPTPFMPLISEGAVSSNAVSTKSKFNTRAPHKVQAVEAPKLSFDDVIPAASAASQTVRTTTPLVPNVQTGRQPSTRLSSYQTAPSSRVTSRISETSAATEESKSSSSRVVSLVKTLVNEAASFHDVVPTSDVVLDDTILDDTILDNTVATEGPSQDPAVALATVIRQLSAEVAHLEMRLKVNWERYAKLPAGTGRRERADRARVYERILALYKKSEARKDQLSNLNDVVAGQKNAAAGAHDGHAAFTQQDVDDTFQSLGIDTEALAETEQKLKWIKRASSPSYDSDISISSNMSITDSKSNQDGLAHQNVAPQDDFTDDSGA